MKTYILAAILCASFGGFVSASADESPEKNAKKLEEVDDTEVIKKGDHTITIKVTGGTYEKTITENEDGSVTVKVTAKPNQEGGTVHVTVKAEGDGNTSRSSSSSSGTAKVTLTLG